MIFANIAGVKIPEGEVVKIASGGVTLWEAVTDGLPAGYEQCEYIQFSAKQQVDTGIVPTQATKIEIEFTRETSSAQYMYGVRNSNNTASVTAYLSNSGAWRFGNTYRNHTLAVDVKHTAIVDATGINMDGDKNSYVGTVKSFTANSTLTLGATRGTSGGLGTPQFTGKIYSFKMWDADKLLAEYIPCRNPDGVYGFWDNVERVFRASEGTGDFTGG